MKRALLALALALLAGCGAQAPDTAQGLRDSKALIGATSRYDAARFKGPWLVRDSFGDGVAQVALVETTKGPAFQLCTQVGCGDGGTLWLAQQQGQGLAPGQAQAPPRRRHCQTTRRRRSAQ